MWKCSLKVDVDRADDYGITFELNVSSSLPRPEFLKEGHFMRIPVNDSYDARLLPYFFDAFEFLDKVREANGVVLVHCLMGISRSPTVAIAYLMYLRSLFVKSQRTSISPNFNFLGQLLEFEKVLQARRASSSLPLASPNAPLPSAPASLGDKPPRFFSSVDKEEKRSCSVTSSSSSSSSGCRMPRSLSLCFKQHPLIPAAADLSPTTALAKLSFDQSQSSKVGVGKDHVGEKRSIRTMVTSSSTSTVTTSFSRHTVSSTSFERPARKEDEDVTSPTSMPGKSRRVEVELEEGGVVGGEGRGARRRRFGPERWSGLCLSSSGSAVGDGARLGGGVGGAGGAASGSGFLASRSTSAGIINRRARMEPPTPAVSSQNPFSEAFGGGSSTYSLAPSSSTSSRAWSVARSDSAATTATSGLGSDICDFDTLHDADSESLAAFSASSPIEERDDTDSDEDDDVVGCEDRKCCRLRVRKADEEEEEEADVDEGVSLPTPRGTSGRRRFGVGSDDRDEDVTRVRAPTTTSTGLTCPVRPSTLTTTIGSFNQPKTTYASLTISSTSPGFRIPMEIRSISRVSRQTLKLSVSGTSGTTFSSSSLPLSTSSSSSSSVLGASAIRLERERHDSGEARSVFGTECASPFMSSPSTPTEKSPVVSSNPFFKSFGGQQRMEIEEKTSGKNTTEDIRQTLAIFEKRASEELEGIRRDLKRLQEAHFGSSTSTPRRSREESKASTEAMDTESPVSEIPRVFDDVRTAKKRTPVSQLVFSAPMYRTQSCPGMLPSEDSSLRSTDGGGSEGDSDSDIRLFRRRRRRERIDYDMTGAARHYDLCFDRSKNRNRYSCGNLEFDSCPDIPHFRGCQSAFPSPHGSSSSSGCLSLENIF
ncbi:unnamed protein product [Notodromas monacha]|uniref:protein-tyrosine-phosphatase n=1 Tax=Notodromas monacha TaxID=399045 RepID=A0A7R9BQ97_9CRUS|nr:unnamed protein product [Notodromas monacha]CAG0918811.1 unnamed protein product [Notodromas monacha]